MLGLMTGARVAVDASIKIAMAQNGRHNHTPIASSAESGSHIRLHEGVIFLDGYGTAHLSKGSITASIQEVGETNPFLLRLPIFG
jgi:hypothetical protein